LLHAFLVGHRRRRRRVSGLLASGLARTLPGKPGGICLHGEQAGKERCLLHQAGCPEAIDTRKGQCSTQGHRGWGTAFRLNEPTFSALRESQRAPPLHTTRDGATCVRDSQKARRLVVIDRYSPQSCDRQLFWARSLEYDGWMEQTAGGLFWQRIRCGVGAQSTGKAAEPATPTRCSTKQRQRRPPQTGRRAASLAGDGRGRYRSKTSGP
jgi:hypothetical protein